MIVGLVGSIYKLEPTLVKLDVNGVIYGVQISTNTSYAISSRTDEKITLFISEIIREDAHLLFGFFEEIEKATFERLIKINGVGPKVALAILSTYTPQTFGKIIHDKDIHALQRVPGIGAKGSGKIMVDLAGFFSEIIHSQDKPQESQKNEAFLALQSLGFKANDISKALKSIHSDGSTQEIVKEALRLLK